VRKRARLKVFVVDEDLVVTGTLTAILNKKGYDAMPYTSPTEAWKAADAMRPHLIIINVSMREMSGFDLSKRVLEMVPTCRILLVSKCPVDSGVIDLFARRSFEFFLLSKPIRPRDLLTAIKGLHD